MVKQRPMHDEFGKVCSKEGIYKTYDQFYRQKTSWDGYQAACAECIRAKSKKYYEENTELCIERSNDWISRNKDRHRELCARWKREHPEQHREHVRKASQRRKEKRLNEGK